MKACAVRVVNWDLSQPTADQLARLEHHVPSEQRRLRPLTPYQLQRSAHASILRRVQQAPYGLPSGLLSPFLRVGTIAPQCAKYHSIAARFPARCGLSRVTYVLRVMARTHSFI